MRYLKRQSTNRRLLRGKGLIYTQYEGIEAQSTGAFLVPKGTQAQRPAVAIEGQLRFNTTLRQLEVYETAIAMGWPVNSMTSSLKYMKILLTQAKKENFAYY